MIVKPLDRILKIGEISMERTRCTLLANLPDSGISLVEKQS